MGDLLALVCRLALAAVFFVAAVSKLRDRAGTAESLAAFGAPPALVGPAAVALPIAEGITAALLVPSGLSPIGAGISLFLLLAFTAGIGLNLVRGNRPACRCFGGISTEPIGPGTILRNLFLLTLALYVMFRGPTTLGQARASWTALPVGEAQIWLAIGFIGVVLLAQSWLLVRLRQENKGLLRQLRALRGLGGVTLPPGAKAPSFDLPTTDGGTLTLDDLLAPRKPLILTFTDPHCGPCQALVPQLTMWATSLRNVLTVGIVSRGDLADNRSHAAEHGLAEVMVQEADEVAEVYGSAGTPSAIRITPQGEVDSNMAAGVDAIRELFESTISAHAEALWNEATGQEAPRPHVGLPVGTEMPDVRIPDLDGKERHLPQMTTQPTLLVFWSPRCGFCHQMVDDMLALERRLPEDHQVVFITSGTPQENRYFGFSSVMLNDPDWKAGELFKASGTPAAVSVEGSRVASPLESGIEAVLSLADQFAGPAPRPVEAPTFLHEEREGLPDVGGRPQA